MEHDKHKRLGALGGGVNSTSTLLGRLRLSRAASSGPVAVGVAVGETVETGGDVATVRSPRGTALSSFFASLAGAKAAQQQQQSNGGAAGGGDGETGERPRSRPTLEQLGGVDGVKAIAESLVAKNFTDERLKTFFEGVSQPMLVKKMRMMLESLLSDTSVYGYNVAGMYRAHMRLKLTDDDFDVFLTNVAVAMVEAGVQHDVVESMIHELEKFRDPCLARGVWDE